jgi:hypothetical protein
VFEKLGLLGLMENGEFVAKWEIVLEIEVVWPFGGLELGFQTFEPCCCSPLYDCLLNLTFET